MIGTLHYPAANAAPHRLLLVMLPGVGIEAPEFFENGMVEAAQSHGAAIDLAIDVIALRPDLELYLDGEIVPALHRAIIEPARAQGYARMWLLGISLGGMGALRYASEHETEIEGLILLAPFLGTRGTVAEVARSGGLATWSADGSMATDQEQHMLVWLRDFVCRQPSSPSLYLGYGKDDRFAPGHRIIADVLPGARVVTARGGHEWATWLRLWQGILDQAPFSDAADDVGWRHGG